MVDLVIASSMFGLSDATWPWIWLGLAVMLAIIELVAVPGSFFVLPWAASAFISALLAFAGVSPEIQWLVFVVGGLLLFGALFKWARKTNDDGSQPPGMGADRLVGLGGIVTVVVDPDDPSRSGKVSVEGESWGALTDQTTPLAVGTNVVVQEMRGTRVVVAPASQGSVAHGV